MSSKLKIVLAIVAVIALFAAGWVVRGWYEGDKNAQVNIDMANQAVADLVAAANLMSRAAGDHLADLQPLKDIINESKKGLQHAPALPADCKPDAVRLHGLKNAVRATNSAASGQSAGTTMPTASGAR